jgi:uncharacterized protein YjhX (UPF0386 family)
MSTDLQNPAAQLFSALHSRNLCKRLPPVDPARRESLADLLNLAPEAQDSACWPLINFYGYVSMNISKYEQRVLHALAQGGSIIHRFDERGRIIEVDCMNRDGWRLDDCTLAVFQKLRRKRMIGSVGGAPYRITREGLRAVRSQLDNR